MRLIAILLALWANRYPQHVDRWRSPASFVRYVRWLTDHLPRSGEGEGALRLAAVLLPPVLLFAVLQAWAGDWLLGIGEMLLGIWALLFLHGPGRVDDHLERFLDTWRQGQLDAARAQAAELAGRDLETLNDWDLPMAALEGLFWQSYRRMFSGIFWLLIVGPIGPVVLHLAVLARDVAAERGDEGLLRSGKSLVYLLDWLPGRASALAFGLAGSFVHAVERWRASQEDSDTGIRELVVGAGVGALDLDQPPGEPEAVEEALRDARDLVGRSTMIWVAVAALLTIAGWLY